MLRSLFEFACVLYIISSVSSVSFGNFCSSDLLCQSPLICSNTSQCICPTSLSFWNTKHNTCLFCPPGWIEWQNQKCLSFIEPPEGGISYQRAKNACLIHGAHLLQIDNHEDVIQLQYKTNDLLESQYARAVDEFLNNGAWIDLNNNTNAINPYDWCELEYENDIFQGNDCVHITKQPSRDKNDKLICLNHVQCNEKLSYICEKSAQTHNDGVEETYQERIFNIVGDLIGGLFGGSKPEPQPQPQTPQIIYQTNRPQPLAAKSDNTILYIGLAIGFVVVVGILLCCFCGGGFLLWKSNDSSKPPVRSSRFRRRPNRTSVDSAASDGTY